MQKLLIAAALIAAGYFAYTEYATPGAGGFSTSTSGSNGFSAMTGAARSVTGGVVGAAARIAN